MGWLLVISAFLAPVAFWWTARALRPLPVDPSPSLISRHQLATFAMAQGLYVVGWALSDKGVHGGVVYRDTPTALPVVFLGIPAAFLALITLVWGLIDVLRGRAIASSSHPPSKRIRGSTAESDDGL
jgi:hypothetical protein